MNYDIFYQGLYFGTAKNMPKDMEEAYKIIIQKILDTDLYSMQPDNFHIEEEV